MTQLHRDRRRRTVDRGFAAAVAPTPLYDFDEALARVKAARAAIDKAGGDVVFTARTEGFIRGRPDIDETIRRLKAFVDGRRRLPLYARHQDPRADRGDGEGGRRRKAINFLNSGAFGFTVSDLAGMGVRRISVGGSLSRVAMHAFIKTATQIANEGKFDGFADLITNAELNKFFDDDRKNARDRASDIEPRPGSRSAAGRRPTPGPRPGPVTLQGRYGRVERLGAARTTRICGRRCSGHDTLWTYMSGYGPFPDFASVLALDRQPAAAGRSLFLRHRRAVRPRRRHLHADGNQAGDARRSRSATSSIRPALQRTPLGTEAQYLLARYVFETLGYRRYEWKCNSLNAPSRRAALRYGFVFEGTLRQHMIAKGRNRDTAYFSMLDSEWPARKAAFERWLAPDNFDADGRQKISLAALNGQKS